MYHVNAGNLPGNDIARTFEGGRHGPSSVSFFLVHNHPGQGPKLHHHPYDETFIILDGVPTGVPSRLYVVSRIVRASLTISKPQPTALSLPRPDPGPPAANTRMTITVLIPGPVSETYTRQPGHL